MTKIIFINGAPRAGKDTCASIMVNTLDDCRRLGFADHLKRATHAAYGMYDVPPFYFENCKDNPLPQFFGYTPRQAYIRHSEFYMKPLHGDDIFGKIWLRTAEALDADVIAISDSGFASEANPVIAQYGTENCLLIRVERDGCSFANDSRTHIELPDIEMAIIQNNGSLSQLHRELISTIDGWLGQQNPITRSL